MPRKNTAERIVEKATELFRDNGYFGASMNDIASGIGLKKASLYNHFNSKEEIAKAVVNKLTALFQSQVFDRLRDKTMAPEVRLAAVSAFLQQYYSDNPSCVASALSMGSEQAGELPREEIRAFIQQWKSALSEILQTSHSAEQAAAMADAFLVKLQGVLVVMRMEGGDTQALNTICEELKGLLAK